MSEKTTLTEAFREFIDDLKNIEPITVKEFTHDTIKDEFRKNKRRRFVFLTGFRYSSW
jgi:hypothetical protein